MSSSLRNCTSVSERSATPAGVERTYDFQINALNVDELFSLYERARFLYPAKAVRLLPHMDRVRDNWNRLLQAGDSLLYVLTAGDVAQGRASVSVWRTTMGGWTWQHLVSESNPLGSRSVMLGGLARCLRRGVEESQQNWFRPENRFPARVFGTMVPKVGDTLSSVQRHMYFAMPRQMRAGAGSNVRIVAYNESHREALCELAAFVRGDVYVTAEELGADVGLEALDALYRRVGLSRTRRVWLAYVPGRDEAVGAALAYRGPLGLNFSFIENRCDLLLHPLLSRAEAATVTETLLEASTAAYADFEMNEIFVVVDRAAVPAVCALGGQFVRDYCEGVWLKDGQPALYQHVEGFYARIMQRAERHRVPPTTLTA